jgi:hypothetical protein
MCAGTCEGRPTRRRPPRLPGAGPYVTRCCLEAACRPSRERTIPPGLPRADSQVAAKHPQEVPGKGYVLAPSRDFRRLKWPPLSHCGGPVPSHGNRPSTRSPRRRAAAASPHRRPLPASSRNSASKLGCTTCSMASNCSRVNTRTVSSSSSIDATSGSRVGSTAPSAGLRADSLFPPSGR